MATIDVKAHGPYMPPFLDMLGFSEDTTRSPLTKHDGYDVIVSSIHGPAVFTDFQTHPYCDGTHRPLQVLNHKDPPLLSDACGRYQLMARYWPAYRQGLRLPDFGPLSQDLVAIQQIKERRAYFLVMKGDIEGAIAACCETWISLPGNNKGQGGGKTLDALMGFWHGLTASL